METNEIIARVLCADDDYVDCLHCTESGGCEYWSSETDKAEAIQTALSESGLVIVPREPTDFMRDAVTPFGRKAPAAMQTWETLIEAWKQENES